MPEVLDWQRGDPRLVVQHAVQELTVGNLVVFPTETGYHIAASALHPEALAALGRFGPAANAVLGVRGLADALRWAPWMGTTARRLARRVWPGPVFLVIDCQGQDAGTGHATGAGTIRLRVPAHEAPLAALDRLEGPLVFIPVTPDAASVEDLVAALGDRVTVVSDDGPPIDHMVPTVVHVHGGEWTVTQAGTVTTDMLQAVMATTVLFVCTGNTCRSPMAEALCKKLLADRLGCQPHELPRRGFLVLSAGLAAMMGLEASPEAVVAARDYGADLGSHRSQPVSAELLARADYLFTMTQSHLRALLPFCPEGGPEPRLLAKSGQDVPDPMGAEPQVYRDCAQQIFGYLQDCLPDIKPL